LRAIKNKRAEGPTYLQPITPNALTEEALTIAAMTPIANRWEQLGCA